MLYKHTPEHRISKNFSFPDCLRVSEKQHRWKLIEVIAHKAEDDTLTCLGLLGVQTESLLPRQGANLVYSLLQPLNYRNTHTHTCSHVHKYIPLLLSSSSYSFCMHSCRRRVKKSSARCAIERNSNGLTMQRESDSSGTVLYFASLQKASLCCKRRRNFISKLLKEL